MSRIASGTRVAAAVLHKYTVLLVLHIVVLALLLLILLADSSPISASSEVSDVFALHPGESMVVYCMDLKRAEAEKTFRGGVVIWCPTEEALFDTYLPVLIGSQPMEIDP